MDAPVTSGSSVVFLLFLLLIGFFVILIPVLIGTYVYKDAKSRNMDAVLWTLVAILVPSFIGLIIYLVIRSNNTNQSCPSCKNPIASEYVLCPYCGLPLKASCPSCAAPVDNGWKLCPKCGSELPVQANAAAVGAAPKKDRRLMWILIVAVAVPVLIFAIGIGGMINFRSYNTGSMSQGYHIDLAEETDYSDVANWVNQCDANGKGVYVLKLSPEKAAERKFFAGETDEAPETVYTVYVYINQYKGTGSEKGFMGAAEIKNKTLEISYHTVSLSNEKVPDYELSDITASGSKINKLKIMIDGNEVEYSLSELK